VESADASEELRKCEWLYQVVIGAGVEPTHPVIH
jgi:hypothetical protein